MSRTLIAVGDFHIPQQNQASVEILKKVIQKIKPSILCFLGDLVDCGQFSSHPPTFGVDDGDYEEDLKTANELIDFGQKYTKERTIVLEGNHEYRIDRWAALQKEGRGAYNLLAPRLQLTKDRKNFTYIRYGSADGRYPHYKVNGRIVAVHGWSYAKSAARQHLAMSQGRSVIFGHTHRIESTVVQMVWGNGNVQARSSGCMCKLLPLYGTGRPVEWVNGFVLGYLGSHSDTLYTIPCFSNFAVLPDGSEVKI